MAEDKEKPVEAVKPYVFDEKVFTAKVEALNDAVDKLSGKPNYNPHKWAHAVGLVDAVRRFKQGERSKELFDLVAGLTTTIPVVDPNYVPPVPYKPELPKQLQPPQRAVKA